MIKNIQAKGDTIDAAIQNALSLLGLADRDDVSIEIIQKPKSGFLGFGREPALVSATYETSPKDTATHFLEGLLIRLGVRASLYAKENPKDKSIDIEIKGDELGAIIGRRGESLDALQYLTSIVANREESDRWHISVDTGNYRAKRAEGLAVQAQKLAQKALKYKRSVALDPMSPQERRIVHATLQNMAGITTYSTGSEPNRRVIIAPESAADAKAAQEGKKPRPQSAQGAGSSQGANRRRRRRRGGGGRPGGEGGSGAVS